MVTEVDTHTTVGCQQIPVCFRRDRPAHNKSLNLRFYCEKHIYLIVGSFDWDLLHLVTSSLRLSSALVRRVATGNMH